MASKTTADNSDRAGIHEIVDWDDTPFLRSLATWYTKERTCSLLDFNVDCTVGAISNGMTRWGGVIFNLAIAQAMLDISRAPNDSSAMASAVLHNNNANRGSDKTLDRSFLSLGSFWLLLLLLLLLLTCRAIRWKAVEKLTEFSNPPPALLVKAPFWEDMNVRRSRAVSCAVMPWLIFRFRSGEDTVRFILFGEGKVPYPVDASSSFLLAFNDWFETVKWKDSFRLDCGINEEKAWQLGRRSNTTSKIGLVGRCLVDRPIDDGWRPTLSGRFLFL